MKKNMSSDQRSLRSARSDQSVEQFDSLIRVPIASKIVDEAEQTYRLQS